MVAPIASSVVLATTAQTKVQLFQSDAQQARTRATPGFSRLSSARRAKKDSTAPWDPTSHYRGTCHICPLQRFS